MYVFLTVNLRIICKTYIKYVSYVCGFFFFILVINTFIIFQKNIITSKYSQTCQEASVLSFNLLCSYSLLQMIFLMWTVTHWHREPVTSRAQRFLQKKKRRFFTRAVAQSFYCWTPNSTQPLSNSHHHPLQTFSQVPHSLDVGETVGTSSPVLPFPKFNEPIRSLTSSSRRPSAGRMIHNISRDARMATSPSCPIHLCTVKSGFHIVPRLRCPSSPLPPIVWSPAWASRQPWAPSPSDPFTPGR